MRVIYTQEQLWRVKISPMAGLHRIGNKSNRWTPQAGKIKQLQ
jgi:hypothetical protein